MSFPKGTRFKFLLRQTSLGPVLRGFAFLPDGLRLTAAVPLAPFSDFANPRELVIKRVRLSLEDEYSNHLSQNQPAHTAYDPDNVAYTGYSEGDWTGPAAGIEEVSLPTEFK